MSHPFGELSPQRQDLGAALRRMRVAAGLSGAQIAERTGISQSRVSRMELGQQSVPVAVAEAWARAAGAEAGIWPRWSSWPRRQPPKQSPGVTR